MSVIYCNKMMSDYFYIIILSLIILKSLVETDTRDRKSEKKNSNC